MAGGTNAVTWGFCYQAVQDTQWLGLVSLGESKIKAAYVSAGDSGNFS